MMKAHTQVLDKGFVRLIDTMPPFEIIEPDYSTLDKAIVDAARASYGKEGTNPLKDKKLINYLIEHGHTSPLEMVEAKFQIKAPVLVWWQHVRHRMQEINLQSGRYVEYDENEMYIPGTFRKQDEKNKQGSAEHFKHEGLELAIRDHYARSFQLYEKMLQEGVAKEQARIVLPGFAMYHTGIVKMNLHALRNYFDKRDHQDAQWEIKQYAKAMKELITPFIPYTASKLWSKTSQPT